MLVNGAEILDHTQKWHKINLTHIKDLDKIFETIKFRKKDKGHLTVVLQSLKFCKILKQSKTTKKKIKIYSEIV